MEIDKYCENMGCDHETTGYETEEDFCPDCGGLMVSVEEKDKIFDRFLANEFVNVFEDWTAEDDSIHKQMVEAAYRSGRF